MEQRYGGVPRFIPGKRVTQECPKRRFGLNKGSYPQRGYCERRLAQTILKEMQKKFIVGIVAVLVVVGGGIFLLQQQKKQSDITPTKWSQAGDLLPPF